MTLYIKKIFQFQNDWTISIYCSLNINSQIHKPPDLHQFIVQLQSKLTDISPDSSFSKQRQIIDYFKPVSTVPGGDFGTRNRSKHKM